MSDSFWLPKAGSTLAGEIDFAWSLVFWIAVFFFVLVVTTMSVFVVRYRRRRDDEIPDAPTHSTRLEVIWTIIPIIIVVGLFTVGFRAFLASAVAPAESMEINVVGERWLWTFSYPDGTTSVNELRVPRGRPVKLILSSKDVIHSFFVPEFRIKRDAVPGRYTSIWFEATETGELDIYCTEYCGTGHSNMLARLVVMEEPDFKQWLETGGGDKDLPPAERGGQLFVKMACNTCHSTDGTAMTGPSLKGLFGKQVTLASGGSVAADENYLRESITNPAAKVVQGYQPVMPVFKGLLDQQQIDALVAYLKSLE
jgi:cytochrome c oxidase subunit 2